MGLSDVYWENERWGGVKCAVDLRFRRLLEKAAQPALATFTFVPDDVRKSFRRTEKPYSFKFLPQMRYNVLQ